MNARSKQSGAKKKSKKTRIRTLSLKRETIKGLSASEQKKVKGGGGKRTGVDMEL